MLPNLLASRPLLMSEWFLISVPDKTVFFSLLAIMRISARISSLVKLRPGWFLIRGVVSLPAYRTSIAGRHEGFVPAAETSFKDASRVPTTVACIEVVSERCLRMTVRDAPQFLDN